jgi:hypothetical protein
MFVENSETCGMILHQLGVDNIICVDVIYSFDSRFILLPLLLGL